MVLHRATWYCHHPHGIKPPTRVPRPEVATVVLEGGAVHLHGGDDLPGVGKVEGLHGMRVRVGGGGMDCLELAKLKACRG